MAKKESKPLHKSLTVQSSVALGVLIILKAVLPVYTGYEIPDELFESLCGLLGVSLTVGLRRALPLVAVCFISLANIQCGPSRCDKIAIEIVKHPSSEVASPPAGKVLIKCDGELKAELLGKDVPKASCADAAVCCEGLSEIPTPEEMEE